MTLRVALYLDLSDWRAVADTIRRSGPGDDWVKIGGLKGDVDGSAGSRTADFFEPHADSAGHARPMQDAQPDPPRPVRNAPPGRGHGTPHPDRRPANPLIPDHHHNR